MTKKTKLMTTKQALKLKVNRGIISDWDKLEHPDKLDALLYYFGFHYDSEFNFWFRSIRRKDGNFTIQIVRQNYKEKEAFMPVQIAKVVSKQPYLLLGEGERSAIRGDLNAELMAMVIGVVMGYKRVAHHRRHGGELLSVKVFEPEKTGRLLNEFLTKLRVDYKYWLFEKDED